MNPAKQLNNDKIRVVLVDDHAMLRKGMALLLGAEEDVDIVGEAGDGEEAIAQVRALKPDIVIMDITMPKLNGIEATRQIVAESPDSKIIALSIHSAKSFVDDMLSAGATGYLLKESVPEELLQGIRAVMLGNMYLSSAITGTVVSSYVERMSGEQTNDVPKADINILQTKLQKPPITSDLVIRRRVFERLNAQQERPLTLVSTPAGYGKSSLINLWLKTCDWPNAWLSLEGDDNDLRQFLNYFIAAVESMFPNACENTLRLSKARQLPPIEDITASLSNELEALDRSFILVLDDYQFIDATSQVNELLQQLLILPPSPLHLMILTRRDPPLKLISLRAKNQLTEMRMLDLKFTSSEVRELLEKTAKFSVTNEALTNLQNKMEGWVVGLRLLSQSLRHQKNPNEVLKAIQSGSRLTQEYLVQEVIAQQSPGMQDCMLKTSILDRFCSSLCNALCSTEVDTESEFNGDSFIEQLVNDNLFAIPLDAREEEFRYQLFFKQFLRRDLEERFSTEEINALHLRASKWLEAEDLIDEALQHAFAADDVKWAADIVERQARPIINEGRRWYLVRKWLSQLPTEEIHARPELLWAHAWVLYREINIAALPAVLDRIDELMGKDTETHALSKDVAVFRGLCAFMANDSSRALQYVEKSLDLAESEETIIHRVLAEFLFGLVGQMDGQSERAREALSGWLNDPSTLNPIRKTNLAQTLVTMSYISTDPSETDPLLQKARKVAKSSGLTSLNRLNDYLDGLFHLQWGELDKAIELLEDALDGKHFHDIRGAVDAMCALTLAYQAHGQAEKAVATLGILRKHIQNSPSFYTSLADFCAARLALMQGRPQDAIRCLRSKTPPSPEVMIFWFEIPCITYCRILIAKGTAASLQKAEQQLSEYAEMNKAHHNTCQLIGILALQAVACDKLNKTDEALSQLEKALTLAHIGDFIFAFLELGTQMEQLVKRYAEQNGLTDLLRRILDGFAMNEHKPVSRSNSTEPESVDAWIGEPLTNREFDILKLLSKRLQNKEIAAKLFISNETVKTHLKHLYQKLNVHNRREAIAKASGILNRRNNKS